MFAWCATSFAQSFTCNNLGQLASQRYPQVSGVGPARTITQTYTHGWLTKISEGLTTFA